MTDSKLTNQPNTAALPKLPRDKTNDYSHAMAQARRDTVTESTGAALIHTGQFSIDPTVLPGNIEGFSGIVQVPMGSAEPSRVDGEHGQGEL